MASNKLIIIVSEKLPVYTTASWFEKLKWLGRIGGVPFSLRRLQIFDRWGANVSNSNFAKKISQIGGNICFVFLAKFFRPKIFDKQKFQKEKGAIARRALLPQ